MTGEVGPVRFELNGDAASSGLPPATPLSRVLRDEFGLTGTKIGCGVGDCGTCTVLLDGRPVCSCSIPVGRVEGRSVRTVEGLASGERLSRLQEAFRRHDAVQCGFCTAGMLMTATALLHSGVPLDELAVREALSGVLCRCTGYQTIVEAVLDAARSGEDARTEGPSTGVGALADDDTLAGDEAVVGSRALRLDGPRKVTGRELYGSDAIPADAFWARIVRSPHHRATFELGDLSGLLRRHPGLVRIYTARDVPENLHGYTPGILDQFVFADGAVRHLGEAILALVGDRETVRRIVDDELPLSFVPEPPVFGVAAAMADGSSLVQPGRPDNLMYRSEVRGGDVAAARAAAAAEAEGTFCTPFVEHAYLEPEAGWARRVGDRVEIHVTTQGPYHVRQALAHILKLPAESIRVVPTACGGGFGGKFDMSVHPIVALAAWDLGRPVACVYGRAESMSSTTKRHPALITGRLSADRDGRLLAAETLTELDTGAYTSAGPTVAIRVPIHAAGPYRVPVQQHVARSWFTNVTPAGGFRGFGIPQAAIAHEALMDDLAEALRLDRWEIRRRNALAAGDRTATGQLLDHSAGLAACLDALKPLWDAWSAHRAAWNGTASALRRGVGIGCMWYGIGATGVPNPSTMRVGLSAEGRITLYSGVLDIGQGGNTAMAQIAAEAFGIPLDRIAVVAGDTDLTADAGKTSASRQTFVSGQATLLACRDLRAQILRLANAGEGADIVFADRTLRVAEGGRERRALTLSDLPTADGRDVLVGTGTFDPPAGRLDGNGQGVPYATYAFGAQIAFVEVDCELGTTRVLEIAAAHDVGRAINPAMVEGQIRGGVAQGLGFALLEDYRPGETDNLHDYLIPTILDVPPIRCFLIEDEEPLGPFGAKGVGEPSLIPTGAAIVGAIRDATGIQMRNLPVTSPRLKAALQAGADPAPTTTATGWS